MAGSVLEFKVKSEKLFERSLPEARWSCGKYAPELPKRKRWPLKATK